jgi:protein transport protein SEC31
MKRKLDDVSKKLEVLHSKLAGNAISPQTISSLHGLVEAVRTGEYPNAMSFHTQIVTTGAFSEISSFMPGIKILIQVAMQLGIYVN